MIVIAMLFMFFQILRLPWDHTRVMVATALKAKFLLCNINFSAAACKYCMYWSGNLKSRKVVESWVTVVHHHVSESKNMHLYSDLQVPTSNTVLKANTGHNMRRRILDLFWTVLVVWAKVMYRCPVFILFGRLQALVNCVYVVGGTSWPCILSKRFPRCNVMY